LCSRSRERQRRKETATKVKPPTVSCNKLHKTPGQEKGKQLQAEQRGRDPIVTPIPKPLAPTKPKQVFQPKAVQKVKSVVVQVPASSKDTTQTIPSPTPIKNAQPQQQNSKPNRKNDVPKPAQHPLPF
jgi:hypothetical protein